MRSVKRYSPPTTRRSSSPAPMSPFSNPSCRGRRPASTRPAPPSAKAWSSSTTAGSSTTAALTPSSASPSPLLRTLRLGVVFDAQQVARPQLLELPHPPLVDLPDRHRVQGVDALPALFARLNQAGLAQHVDMLHHPEPRQVRKRLHDLRRGKRPWAQPVQNGTARGIG